MKIHFLVHDGVMEVGHTRAMMEVLRLLAKREEVSQIKLICLHASDPEILIPDNPEKLEIVTVPGNSLKPFILKSLFFQIYTWIYRKELVDKNMPIITMGVCSFIGNIVNIQFYHQDWEKLYFKYNRGGLFKNLYKAILLRYLSLCEDLYFKSKNLKFVFLSQFIAKSVSRRYQIADHQSTTAYSSVNFEEFLPPKEFDSDLQRDILGELKQKYPVLNSLKEDRPTLLFVGAFERKGLPFLVDKIPEGVNFIIVGKGEAHSSFMLPEKENFFHVEYTKEISKFYLIADAFIFPTHYEPFGLVVTEAVASGTRIFVSQERVGASEIVSGLPGVNFIKESELKNDLEKIEPLNAKTRVEWSNLRKDQLSKYTWELCESKWWKLINS